MQDYIGKQIDRYRVTARLGMGGMAAVYKAYDTRLDRDIALKLIRTRDIPESQHNQMMKRFEREAKAQARFSHPNIVPVHDYGEVDGFPYLVMEYLTGGALKDRITGSIEYQQALRWLIPIADALAYAHERGVVHRDVKPGNILFDETDRPMLTDFGIAKVLMTDQATLTGTGLGIGTPEYMAPEQWQGKASEATDQYALAVVLYELITGSRPFTADTPAAVVILQATEPLQPPRKFAPNIPESLEKLIYKTLSRDPEDRYESMTAFKQALSDLLIERDAPGSEQTIVYDQQTILHPIDDATELFNEDQMLPGIQPEQPQEGTPSTEQVDTTQKAIPKKRLPAWAKWVGLAVLLLCLLGAGIGIVVSQSPALRGSGLAGMLGMMPAQTSTPTETSTPTQIPTQTASMTLTATIEEPTQTPTPDLEATAAFESTLAYEEEQQQIVPTDTPTPTEVPSIVETFDDWLSDVNILVYEDMWGSNEQLHVTLAINNLGLEQNTTHVRNAIGDLMENMRADTTWDLIVIAFESRSYTYSGEVFEVLRDQIDRGTSVVLEIWYIDRIASGTIQPLMQECGITLHQNWTRQENEDLNRFVVYIWEPDSPFLSNPHEITFMGPAGVRWPTGDVGDLIRLIPGSKARMLAGLLPYPSHFGLMAECFDGRMIWQTFSSHDYRDSQMLNLWENYIYNALNARYEYSQQN